MAVAFAVFPLFELDLFIIFQLASTAEVETLADVQLEVLPLYVKVPLTVTDHKVLPDELLQVVVLCPFTELEALVDRLS